MEKQEESKGDRVRWVHIVKSIGLEDVGTEGWTENLEISQKNCLIDFTISLFNVKSMCVRLNYPSLKESVTTFIALTLSSRPFFFSSRRTDEVLHEMINA